MISSILSTRSGITSSFAPSEQRSETFDYEHEGHGVFPMLAATNRALRTALKRDATPKERTRAHNKVLEVAGQDLTAKAVQAERDLSASATQTVLATLRPFLMGDALTEMPEYHFEACESTDKRKITSAEVMKALRPQFGRLKEASESLRIVIETIITNYNGRLTALEVSGIVTNMCDGTFRNSIANCFAYHTDLNEALVEIVRNYAKEQPRRERLDKFQNCKLDMRCLRTSAQDLYDLAVDAHKNTKATKEQITTMAIQHTMSFFSLALRRQMNSYNEKFDFMYGRKIDWPTFIDKSEELNKDQAIATANTARIRQLQKAITGDTPPPSEPIVRDALVQAMEAGFEKMANQMVSTQKPQNQSSGGWNNNKPQTSTPSTRPAKKNIHLYRNKDEGFSELTRILDESNETFLEHHTSINAHNAKGRKKAIRILKAVADANQQIKYRTRILNTYQPQSPPFTGNVFVTVGNQARPVLTDALISWAETKCYRCGEPFCGANANNCLYANKKCSFCFCPRCNRGFHLESECVADLSEESKN
jgi:hypothetical protein